MTETVTGVVEKVNEQNSPPGSARKWTKKAFNVNGEWYSGFVTKENAVSLNSVVEGDTVTLGYETKGNFKNILDVSVVEGNKKEGKVITPTIATSYQDKDYRITFLASRRDAIEFVKSAVQLELVSLGTKKADKMDIFEGLVNEYARRFAEEAYVSREDRAIPEGDHNKETADVE